jgi:hypothetical protein
VRRLAVLCAAVLAAGCSGHHRHVAPQAGVLNVQQERVTEVFPIEGSYSYVRVERDGHKVVQARLRGPNEGATIPLDPGSYRLVSFQRICDGNCNLLDAPSDVCRRGFSIAPHGVVEAMVRLDFGNGCRINFS